jgi:hypothetical protein
VFVFVCVAFFLPKSEVRTSRGEGRIEVDQNERGSSSVTDTQTTGYEPFDPAGKKVRIEEEKNIRVECSRAPRAGRVARFTHSHTHTHTRWESRSECGKKMCVYEEGE